MMLRVKRGFVVLFITSILILIAFLVWSTEYVDGVSLTKTKNLFSGSGQLENVPKIDLSPPEEVKQSDEQLSTPSNKKVNASFISLVRNREINEILTTIIQIEDRFNKQFNYPWTFFNDEEFTDSFKEEISKVTNANFTFVKIEPEDWMEPEWINKSKALILNKKMYNEDHVQYANVPSYHRMCRWNSGKFFDNPNLDQYKYYWRVEPKTDYFCDIDYDVFQFMEDHEKDYGFVINLYDSPQSIRTLFPTVLEFFENHPDYVHENNALQWLTQNQRSDHNNITGGYSTCHFWSNFEIGNLDFFRSQKYRDYFKFLDENGGFFYERWGDAPVHSLGLAMMTDKSRIHWFEDIGYKHFPYFNCPMSSKCHGCDPGKFSEFANLNNENCMSEWLKVIGNE